MIRVAFLKIWIVSSERNQIQHFVNVQGSASMAAYMRKEDLGLFHYLVPHFQLSRVTLREWEHIPWSSCLIDIYNTSLPWIFSYNF